MEFEEIFNKHKGLIKNIIIKNNYVGQGIDFDELEQLGMIGLWKATEKFDESLGYELSTYATPYIKNEIQRSIDQFNNSTEYKARQLRRMKKAINELTQELRRDPTDNEIADRLDLTLEKIIELKNLSQQSISLENSISSESDVVILDFIADQSMTPEEQLIYNEEQNVAKLIKQTFLKTLYPHERIIYKLQDIKGMTNTKIAQKLGVNRERIKTIKDNIKCKLNEFYYTEEYRNITNGRTNNLLKDIIEKQKQNIDFSAMADKYAKYEDYEKLQEKNFTDISTRFLEEYAINLKYPSFKDQFNDICKQKNITESLFCRATNLSSEEFKAYKRGDTIPSTKSMVSFGIYFQLGSHTINLLLETAGYKFKMNDRTHLAYTFILEELKGYPIEYCNKVLELLGIEDKDLLNAYAKGRHGNKNKKDNK